MARGEPSEVEGDERDGVRAVRVRGGGEEVLDAGEAAAVRDAVDRVDGGEVDEAETAEVRGPEVARARARVVEDGAVAELCP